MKTCSKCNQAKPLSEFYNDKRTKSGKRSNCKECVIQGVKESTRKRPKKEISEVRKKHYQENKQLYNERNKLFRQSDTYKKWVSNNKDRRKEYNKQLRESKKNHHIIAINKALKEAKTKDKIRANKRHKINTLIQIANKYNKPYIQGPEQWKEIKGYEGLYKVSSYGRVYSYRSNKVLSLITCKTQGYNKVNIYNSIGKRKTIKVHRLVCEQFIPNPKNKTCINHKDFNRTNNKTSNLEWCTTEENNKHKVAKKYMTSS